MKTDTHTNFAYFLISLFTLLAMPCALARSQAPSDLPAYGEAIEDNSFFIEEAYNQEDRVVQHISNAVLFHQPSTSLVYSFTQEWPAAGQTHQLSYTIPYSAYGSATSTGMGDLLINYRYQFWDKSNFAAFSPRLSVILPTGNVDDGLGFGSVGAQVNLPVSKRLSEQFILHLNAGATLIPSAKANTSAGRVEKSLSSYNTGASLIWLAAPNFNVMLESVQNYAAAIADDGSVERYTEHIVSPGLRYAMDFGSLQIVPGVAVPISFSNGNSRTGMFFYLSFEHPY